MGKKIRCKALLSIISIFPNPKIQEQEHSIYNMILKLHFVKQFSHQKVKKDFAISKFIHASLQAICIFYPQVDYGF